MANVLVLAGEFIACAQASQVKERGMALSILDAVYPGLKPPPEDAPQLALGASGPGDE